MSKSEIFFAHANGFPARTYTKIFSALENEFEIDFIEKLGHNPDFPVNDNWKSLVNELKTEIERRYSAPVIGVGHSLGGILHLLAAADKPELYRQIILLDAPVISRFSSHSLRVLKWTRLLHHYSPSKLTRFRRRFWASREEAFAHFKSKAKFARFDEDVLLDYVRFGTVKTDDGVALAFDVRTEAKIYRTIPHHLPATLRNRLKIPVAYVGGVDSAEARLAKLSFMRRNFAIDFHFLPGTHLFPFEIPDQTAAKIAEICRKTPE